MKSRECLVCKELRDKLGPSIPLLNVKYSDQQELLLCVTRPRLHSPSQLSHHHFEGSRRVVQQYSNARNLYSMALLPCPALTLRISPTAAGARRRGQTACRVSHAGTAGLAGCEALSAPPQPARAQRRRGRGGAPARSQDPSRWSR